MRRRKLELVIATASKGKGKVDHCSDISHARTLLTSRNQQATTRRPECKSLESTHRSRQV